MATNEERYNEAEKLKDAGDLEGAAKKLDELLRARPELCTRTFGDGRGLHAPAPP